MTYERPKSENDVLKNFSKIEEGLIDPYRGIKSPYNLAKDHKKSLKELGELKKIDDVTEICQSSIRYHNGSHNQPYIKQIYNYFGKNAMIKQGNTGKSSKYALKVHIWVQLLGDDVTKDDT